jgi:phosphoribosylformimino-5-aminoimidazole carboxamide ribonucleotide (ProFAR) isomerase
MGKIKKTKPDQLLFNDIAGLIEESKAWVATAVNTSLTLLYWKIGNRINIEVLQNKRAEYGKQIVLSVARQLENVYGKGWDEKTIRHCLRIAETFSEELRGCLKSKISDSPFLYFIEYMCLRVE